jgi:hypothetical protein
MHWKHVVMPVFGAYACSPTQSVHALALEMLVYLPAMHMLQAVAPVVEKLPGLHVRHVLILVAAVVAE